jgi:hypothetical protein
LLLKWGTVRAGLQVGKAAGALDVRKEIDLQALVRDNVLRANVKANSLNDHP